METLERNYDEIIFINNGRLLARILRDARVDVLSRIEREIFDSSLKCEVDFVYDFLQREGKLPDTSTFTLEFPAFNWEGFENTESFDFLIDKVLEGYQVRGLSEASKQLEAFDKASLDPSALLNYLRGVVDKYSGSSHIRCSDYGDDVSKDYDARANSARLFYETGFKELDDVMGGFSSDGREFAVILGRTGRGKSWFLLKCVQTAMNSGIRVGVVSPELFESDVTFRLDSLNAGFPLNKLFRGSLSDDEKREYDKYRNGVAKTFFVKIATSESFNGKITVDKLRAFCLVHKLQALYIDEFSYITDESVDSKYEPIAYKYTRIARQLFMLSRELKIPIIVTVQSNRMDVNKDKDLMPEIWNIRDAEGIGFNATTIISVKYEELHGEAKLDGQYDKYSIKVLKNRRGSAGVLYQYKARLNTGFFKFHSAIAEGYSLQAVKEEKVSFKSKAVVQPQSHKVVENVSEDNVF